VLELTREYIISWSPQLSREKSCPVYLWPRILVANKCRMNAVACPWCKHASGSVGVSSHMAQILDQLTSLLSLRARRLSMPAEKQGEGPLPAPVVKHHPRRFHADVVSTVAGPTRHGKPTSRIATQNARAARVAAQPVLRRAAAATSPSQPECSPEAPEAARPACAPTHETPPPPTLPTALAASVNAARIAILAEQPMPHTLALAPPQPDYATTAREALAARIGGSFDYASMRFSVRAAASDMLAVAQRCKRGTGAIVPVVPSRALPSWHSAPALEDMEIFAAACAQEVSLRSQDVIEVAAVATAEGTTGTAVQKSAASSAPGLARSERLRALAGSRGKNSAAAASGRASSDDRAQNGDVNKAATACRAPDRVAAPAVGRPSRVLRDESNARPARDHTASLQPRLASRLAKASGPVVAFGRRVDGEDAASSRKKASTAAAVGTLKRSVQGRDAGSTPPQQHTVQTVAWPVHKRSHVRPAVNSEATADAGGSHPWSVHSASHMRVEGPDTTAATVVDDAHRGAPTSALHSHTDLPAAPQMGESDGITNEALVAILHGLTAVIRFKETASARCTEPEYGAPFEASRSKSHWHSVPEAAPFPGMEHKVGCASSPASVSPPHSEPSLADRPSLPGSSSQTVPPELEPRQCDRVTGGSEGGGAHTLDAAAPHPSAPASARSASASLSSELSVVHMRPARPVGAPSMYGHRRMVAQSTCAPELTSSRSSSSSRRSSSKNNSGGPVRPSTTYLHHSATVVGGMPALGPSQESSSCEDPLLVAASSALVAQMQRAAMSCVAGVSPMHAPDTAAPVPPPAQKAAPTFQHLHYDNTADTDPEQPPLLDLYQKLSAFPAPLSPTGATRQFLAVQPLSAPDAAPNWNRLGPLDMKGATSPERARVEQFQALEQMLQNDSVLASDYTAPDMPLNSSHLCGSPTLLGSFAPTSGGADFLYQCDIPADSAPESRAGLGAALQAEAGPVDEGLLLQRALLQQLHARQAGCSVATVTDGQPLQGHADSGPVAEQTAVQAATDGAASAVPVPVRQSEDSMAGGVGVIGEMPSAGVQPHARQEVAFPHVGACAVEHTTEATATAPAARDAVCSVHTSSGDCELAAPVFGTSAGAACVYDAVHAEGGAQEQEAGQHKGMSSNGSCEQISPGKPNTEAPEAHSACADVATGTETDDDGCRASTDLAAAAAPVPRPLEARLHKTFEGVHSCQHTQFQPIFAAAYCLLSSMYSARS
jgi:hypothetical protein